MDAPGADDPAVAAFFAAITVDDEPVDAGAVEAGAWSPGPYGAGDRLGTYREVTPARRAAALALIDPTRPVGTFHLGETLAEGYPAFGDRAFRQRLVVSGADPGPAFAGVRHRARPFGRNRMTSLEERVELTFNMGSKINGLHHCGVGRVFYGGRTLDDLVATHGSTDLDTPTWGPPLVTRGLLIDVLALRLASGGPVDHAPDGAPLLPDNARITLDELLAAVARQGLPPLQPGDAVLVRTGWRNLLRTDPERYLRAAPGPFLAETRWLARHRPALVGSDTWCWSTLDPAVTRGQASPCHQELLVRCGIRLGEGLCLEELAAAGVDRFVFCHAPLRAQGAVSSNAPALAIANLRPS